MSINSALLAGVSGLIANSSALAAISDNIANTNTTAYKRTQINFANVVTSQVVKGRYSAGGVEAITRHFIGDQGLIQPAASPTDLAIAGNGFFVVTDKGTGVTTQDPRYFTRSGSFSVDADGYLVNDSGYYLQGWPADATGTIVTDPSDLSQMNSINIKDLGAQVLPTSEILINANLDKRGITGSVGDATYAGGTAFSLADYANNPATGTKPDFTFQMNIIDSGGGSRRVAMAFLKDSAAANSWHAEIYSVPASDVAGAARPGQIAAGLMTFQSDGSFDEANSTLFGGLGNPPNIALAASSAGAGLRWASGLGINAASIDMDLTKFTQFSATSAVASINPDGAPLGNVSGVEVSEDGKVTAIFDNNLVRLVAQIGLATFANPDGLNAVAGNAYSQSTRSGEYSVKEPQLGGAGSIQSSSLEASKVDLSAEFTGLITTQRAYSASSKIITTADQMLEELINMKR
ncbi:MAG: flagellar hook protein FlgE [Phenylobacterium sp.]|uniref:flagellar hook protein FlgE n=1 Tax=Phenylobacterium sp. TaxID=1871053 RepID=UPI0030195C64